MSLKIIKLDPKFARIVLVAAAVMCVAAAWFFIKWNFANAVATRLNPQLAESRTIAESLTRLAPDDPQTHLSAAIILEKTLDGADLAKAVAEYETAAALSPNDYLIWLGLGKARSMSGDGDSAYSAYKRALELAPNYASVQWAYGNSLVRRDEPGEGFAMIAKAASSTPEYAQVAAVTALQFFGGDLKQTRKALGSGEAIDAALASVLASEKRFDEAVEAWSRANASGKSGDFAPIGEKLVGALAAAKKFNLAARVSADLATGNGEKPEIGRISNSGFENGVKLRNAGLFEWQIAEGAEPQVGLGETQPHGGKYSLLIAFNSFSAADFRSVSQTVPVAAGAVYEFEAFYRSDLKTAAEFKWEIVDAANGSVMASTAPMVQSGEWTSVKVRFTVSGESDGVTVRLAREGCAGPTCPVTGKLSFDDLSIRRL